MNPLSLWALSFLAFGRDFVFFQKKKILGGIFFSSRFAEAKNLSTVGARGCDQATHGRPYTPHKSSGEPTK